VNSFLLDAVLLLAVAVVIVPLAQRLGFGSVLGYLLAGLLIGPAGLKLVTAVDNISQASELGVVFLLFIIGLELDSKRLWRMKFAIFGMGSAQIVLISLLAGGCAYLLGLEWRAALVVGMGMAMSSTAISTQILKERNLLSTAGGSAAFAILLFQDIAVIPILTVLPLLAGRTQTSGAAPWWEILLVIGAVLGLGRLVLRQAYRLVASAHLREVFTALSLLTVFALSSIMHELGVSMALGAFMGGVLLATSEYRHAIETDIEPFKGLLLGLFFMSVGMSVDLHVILAQPLVIGGLLGGTILLKTVAHAFLGWVFKIARRERPFFAIVLAQVGEFAFVLYGAAAALGLLTPEQTAILVAVTALSMGSTPLLTKMYDRLWAPRLRKMTDMSDEVVVDDHPEVIIAGFGRVGQIVGRILLANRIRATVLDHDPDQIEQLRRFGFKVYYGDATRLDLLEAAGASNAKILVVAVDGVEDSLAIVDVAKEHFPNLRVVARARNVDHVFKLIDRKVEVWERETFDSSVRMGGEVLQMLGWSPYEAVRAGHKFREHNIRSLHEMIGKRTNQREIISLAKQAREDLERLMAGESHNVHRSQHGWDVHPDGR
jgi:glutathione-regulated potassium-efflux system ancillary protein KefC